MQKYLASVIPAQTIAFPNGTQLTAPFSGEATQWTNDGEGFRAPRLPAQRDTTPALDDALEQMGFVEQETIHLDSTSLPQSANAALRSPAASETVVLEPAAAANGAPQVVLYADEAGGLSWHLPDDFETASADQSIKDDLVMRVSAKRSFTIPTRTAAARRGIDSGQAQMRGFITAIGRKVLKVFVIPIVAEVLAKPMENIVGAVERKHSQNLIRGVTAANYNQRVSTPFTDWASLAGKRSLLVVHGIISSTDGMLSKLPLDALAALSFQYERRVIAYDHFTLSMDPDQNATLFLNQVKQALPNQTVNLDILCHSRGGVVSRALVERGQKLVPQHNCDFGKVFFVATPNAGSALGDAEHIVDMVDVFTNLLTKLPDGSAAYVIEAVLGVLKLLAYTAETALPGLAAMGTQGYIKKTLNQGGSLLPSVVYGAAAANYDPDPNSPHAFFAAALDAVVDRTFAVEGQTVTNDLVVPCDGVHAANGNPMFPIDDPLVYGPTDFVYHNDFFAQPRTVNKIAAFFQSGIQNPLISASPYIVFDPAPQSDDANGGGSPGWSFPPEPPAHPDLPDFGGPGSRSESPTRAGGTGAGGTRAGGTSAGSYFEDADYSDEGFRGGFGGATVPANPVPPNGAGAGYGGHEQEAQEQQAQVQEQGDEAEEAAQVALPAADSGTVAVAEGTEEVLPEVELRREPEIEFHERVTAGEPNELTVNLTELTQKDPGTQAQIEFALAAGQESVTVNVSLYAIGFDVTPDSASMTVARKRDPKKEQAKFMLTARDVKEPVLRNIHANFLLGTIVIGVVTHSTCVVPKDYAGEGLPCETRTPWPRQGFAVPTKARMECNWALFVGGEGPEYEVRLTSRLPGATFDYRDMGVLKMPQADMAGYLNSFLKEQFSSFPQPTKGMDVAAFKEQVADWKSGFIGIIRRLGMDLWQWLPQELRAEYMKQDRAGSLPSSILIHSDEMIFPWELLIPNDAPEGSTVLNPLGVAHILGRWKPGLNSKPKEQMLKVKKIRVLNPDYLPPDTLPWAAEEAVQLQQLFPKLVSLVRPADLPAVEKLFEEPDVQILHFSGHGDVNLNNPNLNKILLEKSAKFEALRLSATKLCSVAQPVVYMNACSVGNVGITVGRAGGFASNFVTNGCSGVIAPLWPINDKTSMEFALALYGKLKLGRAVGEALQELRDQHAEDPTYCAYTFFGDPWVRLNLNAA
jgi:hypothetical protein